jgi:hypothetical protein
VGVLAFGVISEQLKTRQEVAAEEANTLDVANGGEVVTPEGLRYTDLRVGGGGGAIKGYLIILDYKAFANGRFVFEWRSTLRLLLLVRSQATSHSLRRRAVRGHQSQG